MLVGWFGIYWRIGNEEPTTNQFAGPVVQLTPADWRFGSKNRAAWAEIPEALESGEVDPAGKDFGQLIREVGVEGEFVDFEGPDTRPEPSPFGLQSRLGSTLPWFDRAK
jgi:hypothetical protein